MDRSQISGSEIAKRGVEIYESRIRQQIETTENIGKMVIIDIETGDYAIDQTGLDAASKLHALHPNAALYGIRIGYNVSESLGGVMERIAN